MSDDGTDWEQGEQRDANLTCPLCGPLYAAIIVGDAYEAFIQVSGNSCRIDVAVGAFRTEVHRCGPVIRTDEEQADSLAREHLASLGDGR